MCRWPMHLLSSSWCAPSSRSLRAPSLGQLIRITFETSPRHSSRQDFACPLSICIFTSPACAFSLLQQPLIPKAIGCLIPLTVRFAILLCFLLLWQMFQVTPPSQPHNLRIPQPIY